MADKNAALTFLRYAHWSRLSTSAFLCSKLPFLFDSYHFYGACPEPLDCQVRKVVSNHSIPSIQDDPPLATDFFPEAKRPLINSWRPLYDRLVMVVL
ncbi:hypothetical protein PABG_11538 [Paracoccidioides brasiliensis Pb03]|nr:hypothetical protein PABG_11538 [Paracoccidioides brasiliensis Pb03]